MFSYFRAITALSLVYSTYADTVNYDLTIANNQVSPDGFTRTGITVNGGYLGPTIKAQKGDTLSLNVINSLNDPTMRRSTSIHWHGLFQNRTNSLDGPAFVTQCPIAPGDSFLYEIPLHEQTGTFWYHSHLSTQYCDGLRGALVIYDPDDPHKDLYDVDDDTTIITLADHYHTPAPQLQKVYFQTNSVPTQDTGLINGAGRYQGGPAVPWSIVNVEQGKRYRLRVINIACRPFFSFKIDGHNLTIIEADGISTVPLLVDEFDIYAAQRYSAVLNANQPVGNYWIRAPPTGGTAANNPNLNVSLVTAILRYAGAPIEDPTTTAVGPVNPLLEQNLNTLINPGSPGGDVPADVFIQLNITLTHNPFFEINGISFVPPTVPALLQIMSGAKNPEDFIPTEHLFVLPRNKIVEINIPGGGNHPFHLHGHAFDVIQSANSATRNFVNPVRRDVVAIAGGNVTFRFFTDNPGPWFLHCHIDWHLEAGLAVIMGEAPADNVSGPSSQIISDQWKDLCPTYDDLAPDLQ